MSARRYEIAFFQPPGRLLTLEALAESAGVHPALIERYVACGLLEPSARAGAKLFFSPEAVLRARTIKRLREHLGVNLAGIAVILDMRDRLCALQRELEKQRARR